MDLQAVATIGQLVSNVITALKSVREVSDVSDNLDFKSRLSEVYSAFHALQERAIEIENENLSLKQELVRKDEIVGPDEATGYFYHKDRMEQPLCPKCYQSIPSKVVNMGPRDQRTGGIMRFCPVCNFCVTEEKVRNVSRHINYSPYS
jgi:hypothetical protein